MDDRYYILDINKNPIPTDVLSWAKWFEKNFKLKRVAQSNIKQPNRLLWFLGIKPDYWVSTTFLGINHSFDENSPPLIFETMIFRRWPKWKSWLSNPNSFNLSKPPFWLRPLFRATTETKESFYFPIFQHWSEWTEQDMDRYSTWDEAVKGHIDMREKWMKIVGSSHHETEFSAY